ncbi:MAG: HipA N-terminal domain-containing protein [Bdellovibrionales bacterium]|nr:HipA N-terminal domain-containing protein [Bdellovibrionales bacterium]
MASELIALLGSRKIGLVHRDSRGRLSFAYDESWRGTRSAIPPSVSMPLGAAEHRQNQSKRFYGAYFRTTPRCRTVGRVSFNARPEIPSP